VHNDVSCQNWRFLYTEENGQGKKGERSRERSVNNVIFGCGGGGAVSDWRGGS
jgi:hypothetical protein